MHAMPWVGADVWVPVGGAQEDGRTRFTKAAATDIVAAESAAMSPGILERRKSRDEGTTPPKEIPQVKGRLVVTRPWPAMARTVWGDADHAASPGWVGARCDCPS